MPRRSARDDSTDKPQHPSRPGASPRPLNLRQQRFVAEYLVDFNSSQAAIRAGYSARTAGSQGDRLLKLGELA